MSRFNLLKDAGLTNTESEHYGAVAMGKRLSPVPFCYSDKCRGGAVSARKYVSGYPSTCPDCGHSLRWSKVKIESNTSNPGSDR